MASPVAVLNTQIVDIESNGSAKEVVIKKGNPKTVVWNAPSGEYDWLVVFKSKTPFTRWFYHVPMKSNGASAPAVLRGDAEEGTYKYMTIQKGSGVVEDPDVRVVI